MNGEITDGSGNDGKGVLITGCSSGIGRQTAIALVASGFTVFATVRKPADADDLRKLNLKNLVPMCPLDLTNLDHIANVAESLKSEIDSRGSRGLYALINNAGGGRPGPVELMDLDMFRTEVNARLVGAVALVQALLPLIRAGKGRIVWIATPGLIPTPYVSSIHMCDFAVNCLARTLEIELKPWRIRNVMVRCGGIKTPAGLRTQSDAQAVLDRSTPGQAVLYGKALRKWGEEMAAFDRKRTDPNEVARVVLAALAARNPRHHYRVGYMSAAAAFLQALPQSVADWVLKKRF